MHRLRDLIGAGQFGNVYRGVWHSHTTREKEEVAVKTLKEGSGNQEKLWFLQEAAIMGQFKHPNVVTMYGVVTEGEPVSQIIYYDEFCIVLSKRCCWCWNC